MQSVTEAWKRWMRLEWSTKITPIFLFLPDCSPHRYSDDVFKRPCTSVAPTSGIRCTFECGSNQTLLDPRSRSFAFLKLNVNC
uniref:Uncharacterized protein n=1 Tax=Anopheles aquasalis TaxID=42839 RepID=T1DP51_ANOAQ